MSDPALEGLYVSIIAEDVWFATEYLLRRPWGLATLAA